MKPPLTTEPDLKTRLMDLAMAQRAIKVLVRRGADQAYWAGEGAWTQDLNQAADFKSFIPALDYCLRRSLRNVEAVLWFPDPQYNMSLKMA